MLITIETIPHNLQRLSGSIGGDWRFVTTAGIEHLTIRISDLHNWRMNFLFALHELVEAMMCKHSHITTEMVDEDEVNASSFDDPDSFSGYPNSCFQKEHNDALAIEWIVSRLLNVDWKEYGERVNALVQQPR